MDPIRAVIADDHDLVRFAMRTLFAAQQDIRVVGEAASGREALELCSKLSPDVLVLDLRMPDMDGLDACRLVGECSPETNVLILTSYDADDDVFGSFEAGASGYLMKDVAPRVLMDTVRQVSEGRTVLHERISDRLMRTIRPPSRRARQRDLSEREFEVLELMAQGLNNRQIGEALWIGEATVKTHVSRILKKLGADQRTQAILRAVSEGIVELPPAA